MSTRLEVASRVSPRPGVSRLATALPARMVGAALCLAVALVHVKDQGGFPGDKAPRYVGIGYYVLELGAVLAVALLLSRARRGGWLLAIGVALGPLVGYVLSRGPGLPLYSDDRGNWSETIGVISLVVEGVLLVLAVVATLRADRRQTQSP